MTTLTPSDIAHLAQLSRLELSQEEITHAQHKLNALFALVEQIQAVDTTNITPLAHPLEQIQTMTQRLRVDIANEIVDRETNQQSAPSVKDGLYLVPKVIE